MPRRWSWPECWLKNNRLQYFGVLNTNESLTSDNASKTCRHFLFLSLSLSLKRSTVIGTVIILRLYFHFSALAEYANHKITNTRTQAWVTYVPSNLRYNDNHPLPLMKCYSEWSKKKKNQNGNIKTGQVTSIAWGLTYEWW
jgi:hypothetical protein